MRGCLGDKLGEKEEGLLRFRGGNAADSVEDEADDGVGENRNDKTDDSVENGILGVGDFFAIAAGDDVADTAPDKHDDGEGADDGEGDTGELGKNAFWADEFGWHAVGTGGFSAFLDGQSHSFSGAESQAGSDAGDDL